MDANEWALNRHLQKQENQEKALERFKKYIASDLELLKETEDKLAYDSLIAHLKATASDWAGYDFTVELGGTTMVPTQRKSVSLQVKQYKELTELKLVYNYKTYSELIRDLLVDAKDKLVVQVPEEPLIAEKAIKYMTKLDIKAAKIAFYQKQTEEYWSTK